MLTCNDIQISGLDTKSIAFSHHSLLRIQESRLSLGQLFKDLRRGKFSVVAQHHQRVKVLQYESLQILLDTVLDMVVTVIVATVKRISVPKVKIGDLISKKDQLNMQILARAEETNVAGTLSDELRKMYQLKKIKESL